MPAGTRKKFGEALEVTDTKTTTPSKDGCLKCGASFPERDRFVRVCNVCKKSVEWRNCGDDERYYDHLPTISRVSTK